MFRKVKKYLKFVVCCALILSLIAPLYAALSASDGSAFVTKAEFDSALADFNARLTTFEAGINSKIDSQVTSYLDRNGIWNGAAQTLSFTTIRPHVAQILLSGYWNKIDNILIGSATKRTTPISWVDNFYMSGSGRAAYLASSFKEENYADLTVYEYDPYGSYAPLTAGDIPYAFGGSANHKAMWFSELKPADRNYWHVFQANKSGLVFLEWSQRDPYGYQALSNDGMTSGWAQRLQIFYPISGYNNWYHNNPAMFSLSRNLYINAGTVNQKKAWTSTFVNFVAQQLGWSGAAMWHTLKDEIFGNIVNYWDNVSIRTATEGSVINLSSGATPKTLFVTDFSFHLNDDTGTALFFVQKGDIVSLCYEPYMSTHLVFGRAGAEQFTNGAMDYWTINKCEIY